MHQAVLTCSFYKGDPGFVNHISCLQFQMRNVMNEYQSIMKALVSFIFPPSAQTLIWVYKDLCKWQKGFMNQITNDLSRKWCCSCFCQCELRFSSQHWKLQEILFSEWHLWQMSFTWFEIEMEFPIDVKAMKCSLH